MTYHLQKNKFNAVSRASGQYASLEITNHCQDTIHSLPCHHTQAESKNTENHWYYCMKKRKKKKKSFIFYYNNTFIQQEIRTFTFLNFLGFWKNVENEFCQWMFQTVWIGVTLKLVKCIFIKCIQWPCIHKILLIFLYINTFEIRLYKFRFSKSVGIVVLVEGWIKRKKKKTCLF